MCVCVCVCEEEGGGGGGGDSMNLLLLLMLDQSVSQHSLAKPQYLGHLLYIKMVIITQL